MDTQIKQLLQAAFLSKQQIADRLNVPLSEVERVEREADFSEDI